MCSNVFSHLFVIVLTVEASWVTVAADTVLEELPVVPWVVVVVLWLVVEVTPVMADRMSEIIESTTAMIELTWLLPESLVSAGHFPR